MSFTGNFEPIWRLIETYQLPYEVSALLFTLSILLLLISYCVFLSFENKEIGSAIAILFIGGLCTGFILGFSPTIIASAFRVFFILEMLLSIIVASLYMEFFRVSKNKLLNITVSFISFIVILIYMFDNIKKSLKPFTIYYF